MLRALFEGVMFEHRRHIEVLAQAGVSFSRAALSGGGARSAHWPQIFADGLGVPVTVAECGETGALGAAIAAAVGAGLYPRRARRRRRDDTARPAPSRPTRPCAATTIAAMPSGRELTEAVDPLWRRLACKSQRA